MKPLTLHTIKYSTNKKTLYKWIFSFIALFIFMSARWLSNKYSLLTVDTILFLFNTPLSGVDKSQVFSYIRSSIAWPIAILASIFFIMIISHKYKNYILAYKRYKIIQIAFYFLQAISKKIILICTIIIIISLMWIGSQVHLIDSIIDIISYKTFDESIIDKEYKNLPENVTFSSPKNLIWVIMESGESTFANEKIFGVNLLPGLTSLPGIRFHDHIQAYGTSWTVAGLTGYILGLPLKVPLAYANDMGKFKYFLSGAKGLTDVLSQAGYNVWFTQGVDIKFAAEDVFLEQHGVPRNSIQGLTELLKRFPELKDKTNQWGIRDNSLLEIARQDISALAASDQPFAYIILSIDGHSPFCSPPPGYASVYHDYRDTIMYYDEQFTSFASWVMSKVWYENTLLVFTSDHLNMGSTEDYSALLDKHKHERRNFNLIMNSSKPIQNTERTITHFDMLPTIIEALGGHLPERKLGLGVSLFSSEPTLAEQYGTELNTKLRAYSKLYNTFFTP